MSRSAKEGKIVRTHPLLAFGLKPEHIEAAVDYVYDVLDTIDQTLLRAGSSRLAELVELANLSAIIGNLFRGGITKGSNGAFKSNRPHTYPDLLGVGRGCCDIEIKVALETNKPKGHLVKPGPHITVRYVLGDEDGTYTPGKKNRGHVVWLWEVRAGVLRSEHFSCSNTEGDSGKTAVINAQGMQALAVVYCDLRRCPHPPSSRAHRAYSDRLEGDACPHSLSE